MDDPQTGGYLHPPEGLPQEWEFSASIMLPSLGVQHQVDEPPDHLALRPSAFIAGAPRTEENRGLTFRGRKQNLTQKQSFVKSWTRPACGAWRSPGEVLGSWLWLLPETQMLEAAMIWSPFSKELRTVGLCSQPILSVLRL